MKSVEHEERDILPVVPGDITTTTSCSTAAISTLGFISFLLVFRPAFSPVTVILAVAITTSTTATTAAVVEPVARLETAGFDLLDLLVTILLLTLDQELGVTLPLWLGVESQECLLGVLRVEFDEDASLEGLVIGAAETDGASGAELGEERLDVELGAWFFLSETLGVDALVKGLIFEHFDGVGIGGVD